MATRRARKFAHKRAGELVTEQQSSTIACVSGFLVNMVDSSVRLISPCNASERWPLGYWVLASGEFGSAGELRDLLRSMIDERVRDGLSVLDRVRLRRDVRMVVEPDRLQVISPGLGLAFDGQPMAGQPMAGELAALLADGTHTVEQVALRCRSTARVAPIETLAVLDRLFASRMSTVFLAGEWTFAAAAFGDDAGRARLDAEYPRQISEASERHPAVWRGVCGPALVAELVRLRAAATRFVDEAARRVLATGARVVGCTSTFEQHVASLALLRRIRELDQEVVTMLGGANCETVMGQTTHRCFPTPSRDDDRAVASQPGASQPGAGQPSAGQPGLAGRRLLRGVVSGRRARRRDRRGGAARVCARVLFVSYRRDWRYPAAETERMHQALLAAGGDSRHAVLDSGLGHGAFLFDVPGLAATVADFVG